MFHTFLHLKQKLLIGIILHEKKSKTLLPQQEINQ